MKNALRISTLLAAITLSGPVTASGYNVLDLRGKSEHQISDLLGMPDSCNETYQGRSCEYKNHDLEIIFIGGRADWITYDNLENVPFDHSAVEYIGLKKAPPLLHNPTAMHWQHHHGMEVISVYGSGKKAVFIQVRAYTPQ